MAATSRGIDVSGYQGAQDWAALVRGGLTYAAAKASEGEHTHDPHYRLHMDGMRGAAVLPQAYHYAWPNQDAHAEADNYLSAVHADASEVAGFVHFLDLERRTDGANYAGVSASQIRAYAEAWIDRVKAACPRQRVGCYTSASDIAAGHYPRNADFLFYPAYPAGPLNWTQAEQRSRPNPGVTPLFWQFASSPTDRSICYMTPAAYKTWAGHQEDDMPTAAEFAEAVYARFTKPGALFADIDNPTTTDDKTVTPRVLSWETGKDAFQANNGVRQVLGLLGALSAGVAALAKDSKLTAEQITEAAKAGGLAALAEGVVHVEVTGAPPAPTAPPAAAKS
jgi:GH25 family lysozyme M1 (1,4-beta-N-acetylmuramidase)